MEQQIINYIIEASIDPVLICNNEEIKGINIEFVSKLGYNDVLSVLNQNFQEFLNIHFYNTLDIDNKKDLKVEEITHCNIISDCLKQTSPIKIKRFNILENEYFTIVIGKCSICDSIKRNLQCEDGKLKLEERIIRELSSIFEALPCMLIYSDSNGTPVLVNKKYQKYCKLTENEDITICMDSLEAGQFKIEWNKNILDQTPFSMFLKLRGHPDRSAANNAFRWHVMKSTPVKNGILGIASAWITTITDIHDMKQIEEEKQRLIASEKLAIEENKMKTEFIAMMSHELRTPLFGVIGCTNLLLQSDLNEEQKEIMENIDRSSQLLLTVIQDILEFSKIESGNMTIQPQEFYVNNLFKDIEHTMKIQAKNKNIDLIVEQPQFDYKIVGDSCRLLQILINLTSNSIKFTKKGYVNIKVEINTLNNDEIELLFRVIDTGIGISKASQMKLFKKWAQIENNEVKKFEGSGLGLFICNSLVSLMNGQIGIISELGKGTEVWVRVKLPYVNNNIKFEKDFIEGINAENKVKKEFYRVLIAEDNEMNQKIITKFLEKIANFKIDLYENGKFALTQFLLCDKGHYDLIILDQLMPEMNGDAVCQAIRNIDTEVIVISASANPNKMEELTTVGYTDSIPKPFTYNQLKTIIKKYLNI